MLHRILQQRSFAAFVAPLLTFVAFGACSSSASLIDPPSPQQNGDGDSNANPNANNASSNGVVDSGGGAESDAMDKSGPPAATPTFSPPAGTYNTFREHVCLSIASTTPLATIHYTTDGSTPTPASPIFTKRLQLQPAPNLKVQAIAVLDGFTNSSVGSAAYEIFNVGMLAPVSFNPSAGNFPNAVDVTLNTTELSAIVCYTTDTSTPSCSPSTKAIQEDPCNPHPTPLELPRTCTGTSKEFLVGTPIHIEPSPSGITIRAVACPREDSQTDITAAVYTFQ